MECFKWYQSVFFYRKCNRKTNNYKIRIAYYAFVGDSITSIFCSIDSGMTWKQISKVTIPDSHIPYYFFKIDDTLYLTSSASELIKSGDGINWTAINRSFIYSYYNFVQVSDNEYFGIEIQKSGKYNNYVNLYYSNDKCKTWNKVIDGEAELLLFRWIFKTESNYLAIGPYSWSHNYIGHFGYLGIDEVKNNSSERKIYPNPSSTLLNFDIEHVSSIFIYESTGKLIMEIKNPLEKQIHIDSLKPGIYYIRLISDTEKYSVKFIKE